MTPNQRRASAAAIAAVIAVGAEGTRQYAYYDPPGVLTVCIGHTGPDVIKGKKYSLEECRKLFDADMAAAVAAIDACVPNLPVPVLAAFADAGFNIGRKIACNKTESTAARMLAAGDYTGACNQLLRWNKAKVAGAMVALPGLTTRRGLERDVCLTYLND